MGTSTKTLNRLLKLRTLDLIGPGSKMVELGAQNLNCDNGAADVAHFVEHFRGTPSSKSEAELGQLAHGGSMSRIMQECGMDYLALDIFDYESTMLFDLNIDQVPPNMLGAYDIVTNFGTTEHILGQYNALHVIHDLTKVGGVIYHDLPMGGYHYHGYFSYNPLLFHHLAMANGYEIVFRNFSKVSAQLPYGTSATDELLTNGWPDTGYHDVGIEFIFRKTKEEPFRVPIEIGTSHSVDREFLLARDKDIAILAGMRGEI